MNRNEKLVMKDDIMFKAFFSRTENERFLKDFLSAILGKDMQIKEVIHDKRLEQLARESKYAVLDLDVKLESGELINIEMQLRYNRNIEKRTTFYASKKVTEQLGPNEQYESLRKVIIISILDYSFIELPEFLTKTVRAADKHREYELNNEVTYYYIELEKFRKQDNDMNEKINQWLAFIDMERGDLLDMAKENSKIIQEAYDEYEVLTGDEDMKRLAEVRLMSHLEEQSALATARYRGTEEGLRQGREEGMKKGLEEGLEQGKKEGLEQGKKEGLKQGEKKAKEEMALRMLKIGISKEEIMNLTELKENEIEEILQK